MTAQLEQLALPTLEPSCAACRGIGVLEATDIFAGAGGSSLGLEAVRCHACGRPLIRVVQALNHDHLAVEAHNENFPHADHDVHDIQKIPASRFKRTPLLWASPDCGHHAYCRGKRNTDEEGRRARATFNDIVRFTEYHRYDAVIVENVIEARLWCDTRGHPKKCNCGSHFDAWYASMVALGYSGQIVYFNSQFALPTPQSRDRMYVVFWRDGLPEPQLDFRPASWCSACETIVRGVQTWKPASKAGVRSQPGKFEWGRYGTQYLYRCPDCQHPVAPAVTGARTIIDSEIPIERIGDRPKDLAKNTRERIKYGIERLQTVEPIQVQVGGNLYERRPGVRVWSVDAPMRTITATSQMALVVRAGGLHHGLLVYNGVPGFVRDLGDAAGTLTSRDKQSLLIPYYSTGVARPVDEPMGTVTSKDRQALVITDADIDDCYFRMLQWPELLRAQQMHEHGDGSPYRLTARRRVRGKMAELSNEQRVRMIGMAVSSPVATMLGYALVDVLRSAP